LYTPFSTIAVGDSGEIWYGDTASVLGGGEGNAIDSMVIFGTIAAGNDNIGLGDYFDPVTAPTISSGFKNTIEYDNEPSIGGGVNNRITRGGPLATIP